MAPSDKEGTPKMLCDRCSGTGVVPCLLHNWEWPGSCDFPDECPICDGTGFEDDLTLVAADD